MKQIDKIEQLKPGDKLVHFDGDRASYWKFLMIHPDNPNYVLLIDELSKNAIKHYIPNLVERPDWFIDFTYEEVQKHILDYYRKQGLKITNRLSKVVENAPMWEKIVELEDDVPEEFSGWLMTSENLFHDGYKIALTKLEKLPKED